MAVGTFKGINTEGIPNAKAKINEYITSVETYLGQISQSDFTKAFKGQYTAGMQNFVRAVSANAKSVLNELNTFDEKIEAASKRYSEKDAELASSIPNSGQNNG